MQQLQENAAASHFLAFLQESITARLTLKSARKCYGFLQLRRSVTVRSNSLKLENFYII